MPELAVVVLLFTGFITLLSLLIVAARSVLVVTGEVAVIVNEERIFDLNLGRKLLFELADHGLFLPSACGGRGTCGQCRVKVLEGGGPLLPTETALITPRQAAQHERLACQLSIKSPMRIRVAAEILGIEQLQCSVLSNHNVASFIKELVLELPTGHNFEFRAGSYIQVEAPPYQLNFCDLQIEEPFQAEWARLNLWRHESQSKERTIRAYSLANFPGESNQLILNVRIATPPPGAAPGVPAGIVSSYLFSLKPGGSLAVTGPFGDFAAKPTDSEMVFIGGGAGMAPMRSIILDQLIRVGTHRKMSFWYGARSLKELFYVELFEQLASDYDNFDWHVALSEPLQEDSWLGSRGFIHQVVYERLLKEHPHPETCEYYLCGPTLMMDAVISMLRDLGVEDEQIAMDDFGGAEPPRRNPGHRHGG